MHIEITLAKMAAFTCASGVVMAANIPLLVAHEAYLANISAKIADDSIFISPLGDKFCNDGRFKVSIRTVLNGADIYYTTDGTIPECSKNGNMYSAPFMVTGVNTIKAVSCHDEKQSAIASRRFEISADYCQPSSGPEQKGDDNKKPEDGTAGGIKAKLEDAPEDALIQNDAGDKNKDGNGSGGNQGMADNNKEATGGTDGPSVIDQTAELSGEAAAQEQDLSITPDKDDAAVEFNLTSLLQQGTDIP